MLISKLVVAVSLAPFSWVLTSESSGFFTTDDYVGTLTGPHTFPDPNLTYTNYLVETVWQDKGDEEWDVPWSEDLEELGFVSYPYEFEIPATGTIQGNWIVYHTVRTDWHTQHWNGAPFHGTAIRHGMWDSHEAVNLVRL